jgi:hypothetical protein
VLRKRARKEKWCGSGSKSFSMAFVRCKQNSFCCGSGSSMENDIAPCGSVSATLGSRLLPLWGSYSPRRTYTKLSEIWKEPPPIPVKSEFVVALLAHLHHFPYPLFIRGNEKSCICSNKEMSLGQFSSTRIQIPVIENSSQVCNKTNMLKQNLVRLSL